MSCPLRVTVVAPYGVVGGAELWLLSLLDVTDRLDVNAVLLADGPLRDEFARRGIPFATRPTGRSAGALAGTAAWLFHRLRTARPDVVLANGVKAATVAAPAARLAGVPCVWAKHDHSFDGPLTRALAALTDMCIGTEPGLVAASRHPRPVEVPVPAPSGTALPRTAAREQLVRRGARLGDDERLLLTISRLVSYKGVDDAVAALARPGGEQWRLAVVGPEDPSDPGERRRLTRLAEELGVADRVDFAGWIEEAWRVIPAADSVAVLTKPDGTGPGQEAFGGTAIEAMLNGVPVITTGPGSVADRVAGPASVPPGGIAVPPADPAKVADALGRLADPGFRAAMGRAGLLRTAANPGPRDCARLLAQALSRAARLPGAGLEATAPVSVVVTVLNRGEAVDGLITALLRQLTVDGDELVVVDRGSSDDTARRVMARASQDARIRPLVQACASAAAGRDAGARASANALVAWIDADCTPAPDWVARMRAAADDSEAADLLAGVCRVTGHGVASDAAALTHPLPEEIRRGPGPWTRMHRLLFGPGLSTTGPYGRSLAFTRRDRADAESSGERPAPGADVYLERARPTAVVASAEVSRDVPTPWREAVRQAYREGVELGRLANRRQLAGGTVRGAGYASALAVAHRHRGVRSASAAGGVVCLGYLSLPVARAVHRGHWGTLSIVPMAVGALTTARAAGALHGLADRVGTNGRPDASEGGGA
ncbi:glycosyltransferase [Streptomyces sp. YS415]|uniref:glycosyltransferase n=1 Tax=Streptomyces sp. YS415 TaxID=2944806 RepID=UPI0020210161|nr:glycosyltransferase [Streptomyces sp. YS415]MCL7425868.1 glycosyltransferase [Streptomyces sp. YS415]